MRHDNLCRTPNSSRFFRYSSSGVKDCPVTTYTRPSAWPTGSRSWLKLEPRGLWVARNAPTGSGPGRNGTDTAYPIRSMDTQQRCREANQDSKLILDRANPTEELVCVRACVCASVQYELHTHSRTHTHPRTHAHTHPPTHPPTYTPTQDTSGLSIAHYAHLLGCKDVVEALNAREPGCMQVRDNEGHTPEFYAQVALMSTKERTRLRREVRRAQAASARNRVTMCRS